MTDYLSEKIISEHLTAESYGKKIIILDKIDSTNNYAKNITSQAENGTVVIANYQTNGKGRMGKSFFSPESDGIYMSIIIKTDLDISLVSLITPCTAVAVAEAIEEVCSADVKIKWVNDLFINNRKVCGILTESSLNSNGKKMDYIIIGIGVNVRCNYEFPIEIRNIATSLENETSQNINRNILCAKIIQNVEKQIKNIENREFMKEYRQRSFIIGKKVLFGGMDSVAVACGIDDYARLIIRFEDNTEIAVNSGEVRIIT